jgi:predicted negative regulator of RcsB-dependent stress response
MAALVSAKTSFDANDLKSAKSQLQWVIDSGKGDEYKALAEDASGWYFVG